MPFSQKFSVISDCSVLLFPEDDNPTSKFKKIERILSSHRIDVLRKKNIFLICCEIFITEISQKNTLIAGIANKKLSGILGKSGDYEFSAEEVIEVFENWKNGTIKFE